MQKMTFTIIFGGFMIQASIVPDSTYSILLNLPSNHFKDLSQAFIEIIYTIDR